MNSAEVLGDQGSWDRSLALLDDAGRNYEAVGYAPGDAAAVQLFSGVAAMRSGDLGRRRASLVNRPHAARRWASIYSTRSRPVNSNWTCSSVGRRSNAARTWPASLHGSESPGAASPAVAPWCQWRQRGCADGSARRCSRHSRVARCRSSSAPSPFTPSDVWSRPIPTLLPGVSRPHRTFEAFGVVRTPPLRPSDLPVIAPPLRGG